MIIWDTETTGLFDNHSTPLDRQPEVIELCAIDVDLDSGEIKSEFNELFKPVRPISDEITKITGITNEMVKDAQSFGAYQKDIAEMFAAADGVLAHNLSFDMEIIEFEYERMGRKIVWPKRLICTVESTVHLKGFRLSLTMLHELLFQSRFPEAHRAKTDVTALIRCAIKLRELGEI